MNAIPAAGGSAVDSHSSGATTAAATDTSSARAQPRERHNTIVAAPWPQTAQIRSRPSLEMAVIAAYVVNAPYAAGPALTGWGGWPSVRCGISHASERSVVSETLLRPPAAASARFAVTQQGPEFFGARNGAGKTLLPKEGENPGDHSPIAIS
jgi:hypothetical protein